MSMTELTVFFGWMSAINLGVLIFSVLIIMTCRGGVQKIHSKMMGVSEETLPAIYMDFLGRYKLMIIVFNLVPYFALRIIG